MATARLVDLDGCLVIQAMQEDDLVRVRVRVRVRVDGRLVIQAMQEHDLVRVRVRVRVIGLGLGSTDVLSYRLCRRTTWKDEERGRRSDRAGARLGMVLGLGFGLGLARVGAGVGVRGWG